MFFPLPLYLIVLWLVWFTWRRRSKSDRKDALYFYLLSVGGSWVAVLIALIPNQEFLTPFGVSVLVWGAFLATEAAVIGGLVYLKGLPKPSDYDIPLLYQVYKKWCTVFLTGRLDYNKYPLRIVINAGPDGEPDMSIEEPVDRVRHFKAAKSLLEHRHNNIYKDWVKVNTLVEKCSALKSERYKHLVSLFQSQMNTEYPTLREQVSPSVSMQVDQNYYRLDMVIFAFDVLTAPDIESPFPPSPDVLYKENDLIFQGWTLKFQAQLLICSNNESDADTEHLKKIFENVSRNPLLIQMTSELNQLWEQSGAELKDFCLKLDGFCEEVEEEGGLNKV